jgi:hypothetical protein
VDHFQGDTQNELHKKVPHDVLNSAETNMVIKIQAVIYSGDSAGLCLVKDLLEFHFQFF